MLPRKQIRINALIYSMAIRVVEFSSGGTKLESITKNVLLNWYSSMKKKIEKDSDDF